MQAQAHTGSCAVLRVPIIVTSTLYSFGRSAKTDEVTSEGSGLCPVVRDVMYMGGGGLTSLMFGHVTII